MKALLKLDPRERLSGMDVLLHPYFDDLRSEDPEFSYQNQIQNQNNIQNNNIKINNNNNINNTNVQVILIIIIII